MTMNVRPGSPAGGDQDIHIQLGRILREVANLGSSVSALHVKSDMIATTQQRITDDRLRDRFDIERYGRRIASLEHQMALVSSRSDQVPDWKPDPKEVTGTHDFAVIKAEFEKMQAEKAEEEKRKYDSEIWWKRQRWLWVAGFFFIVVNVTIGGCSAYAVNKFTQPAAPAAK